MLKIDNAPAEVFRDNNPQVGDIYRKAGGTPGFWWVIAVCNNGDAYVLALDNRGQITGAQRYGRNYFAERDHRRVGFATIPVVEPEWLL
jgi:hypothetical protein